MSENLTASQVQQVAKIAALQVLGSVRDQITDVVRYEIPTVVDSGQKEKEVPPKYSRRYFDIPLFQTSSNYTKVLMASAMWRAKKGKQLASAWMFKPDTKQKILIEQYGQECSVLRMDMDQKQAVFDPCNQMTEPGLSIWTDFAAVKGVIEDVLAMQAAKGWVVVRPERKHQLTLLDALA